MCCSLFFGGVIDSSLDLFVAVESLLLFTIVAEDAAVNIRKEKKGNLYAINCFARGSDHIACEQQNGNVPLNIMHNKLFFVQIQHILSVVIKFTVITLFVTGFFNPVIRANSLRVSGDVVIGLMGGV